MLYLLDALHLGRHTFRVSCTTPESARLSVICFEIHIGITFSTNNGITRCNYYVQIIRNAVKTITFNC